MESKARDFFFKALVKSAENYRKTMDEKTGRFLASNGGWAVTNQDAMVAYAYLYVTPGKENPYFQNPEALDTVIKAAQALRDWQYPDGQVEFIKIDGSKWGPIYMPWTFYHWLETYILIRDLLPDEIRKDWEIGLMPAMESYGKQDPEKIHNIPVWQAMCVHRAGKFFGREDWIENADALIRNTCLAQDECGFWPEHKGPTTTYNFVYTHALGLYRFHGGKVDVLEALKRAIRFMQVYAYPNGALVETIDGRTKKYSRLADGAKTGTRALPGCLSTRGGQRFIEAQLNKYSPDRVTLADTAILLIAMDQIDDSFVDPDPGFEGFDQPDFTAQYGLGNIVRKGNREICLSAYTAPITESRWGMDRQMFVSVWTPESDLVLGGGNSKNQVDLSTFVIKNRDGSLLSYIPSKGKIAANGKISLDYGAAVCSVAGDISDNGTITLQYTIDKKDPKLQWQVGLPLKPELDMEKAEIISYRNGCENIFEFNGAKVRFEGDCRVILPSRTFNPYAEDGKPPLEECVMLVNVYPKGNSLTVTIEPAEKKLSPYPQNVISER